jgi:hypothetical protein
MQAPNARATRWCLIVTVAWGAGLSGCGGEYPQGAPPSAQLAVPRPVTCSSGDQPETGLQGQVPAALRATGFNGFNCNLELVGQYRGEGASFSSAWFRDRAGHTCAYYATALPKNVMTGDPIAREHPGVAVVDITDPSRPTLTTSLTSTAMIDPWESLVTNPRRQVLAGNLAAIAGVANSGAGGPEIDFYDLSGDCRNPPLISSKPVGTGSDGGIKAAKDPVGHEAAFAPDGLTYYVGDIINQTYNAVDISDMGHPKLIAQFSAQSGPLAGAFPNGSSHGLSISEDGNRAYVVSVGTLTPEQAADPAHKGSNGFYIVDTSEVQARKPGAKMKVISTVAVKDGTFAQHTIPITIGNKPYLVFVDECGGVASDLALPPALYMDEHQAACDLGVAPFPMARLFDISDERNPRLIAKLMLETHDPANCEKVLPDIAGQTVFTYGSHYCTVDNRQNATALACAYFNSGIRVFDIRDPERPREIAYYNPAGSPGPQPGSVHSMLGQWQQGGPDWCTSRIHFDFERRLLTTTCMDNGLLVLKFADGVWPLPESTPAGEQTH